MWCASCHLMPIVYLCCAIPCPVVDPVQHWLFIREQYICVTRFPSVPTPSSRIDMWFSISCYPPNTLSPSMEVLHVSPQLEVPLYMKSRFRELPECQCKGRHFVWSRSTLDLTTDDSRRQILIRKCQYYEPKESDLTYFEDDSDDNNNTKIFSEVLNLFNFRSVWL